MFVNPLSITAPVETNCASVPGEAWSVLREQFAEEPHEMRD
jgi:hypothetical protein